MFTKKIIRIAAVESATGLSRSTIYEKIAHGEFPKQVALDGPRSGDRRHRAVGWVEEEVAAWVEGCIAISR